MVQISRAKLGQLAIVVLVLGAAVAAVISVSKLTYPTVATYPGSTDKAATVEPIQGTGVARIILSQDAAKRIGLQTSPVLATQKAGKQTLVIPYAAIFYDPSGATWAYVATRPLVFVREAITVTAITGDVATLSAGPAVNAQVVTVGLAVLYGTEVGVQEG
jgi:hypothetical protein